MIEWELVAKIAGGGYGVSVMVLVILAIVAWIMSLIIQKTQAKEEETPAKETPAKEAK